MAPKGTKRSPKAVASPEPKKAKADPLLVGVLDALRQAEGLPEGCRAMLAAGAPAGLGTPVAERHELQAMLVSWIGEVVDGTKAKLQEALDEADEEEKGAEVKKQGLEGKVADAKAALEAEDASVATKESEMNEATKAAEAAKAALAEAQEKQKQGDAKMMEATKEKEGLEQALDKDFMVLKKEEGFQVPQAEKSVQALTPIAKRLSLDQSLRVAMPAVAAKLPAERGTFDHLVLDQLEKALTSKVQELREQLEAGKPAMEERASAVQAAQSSSNAAEERQQAASAALAAAREQRGQAATALSEAEAAVAAFVAGRGAAKAAREEKDAALQNFIGYNVECFTMLRDKAAAPAEA
mmetsp:Transcript_114627/g.319192  ORF Transcript_114627/g.319192 Transcript_114627/m.319192 type:complete len:354 (-) Transcript_114627:126-1187(-)